MREDGSREDDEDRNRRRRPPRRKRSYLPLILGAVAATLVICCCGGGAVGYFLYYGSKTTDDPQQVKTTLDRATDITLPPELAPRMLGTNAAGRERVVFATPSGRSFIELITGPGQRLAHESTIRESRDRGKSAAGGQPEEPVEKRTIRAEIRSQPAEFVYKRYAGVEIVSGYFLGKQHPVVVEAEFDLREFPVGTADKIVSSIR